MLGCFKIVKVNYKDIQEKLNLTHCHFKVPFNAVEKKHNQHNQQMMDQKYYPENQSIGLCANQMGLVIVAN